MSAHLTALILFHKWDLFVINTSIILYFPLGSFTIVERETIGF